MKFHLVEILVILFIHWVADFVTQTDKQATGKSKEMTPLLEHTITYTIIWAIPAMIYLDFWAAYTFLWITFVFHTFTDYFTSRLNSKLWEQKRVHDFFVSIGFDQWLHYVQLFTTYWILTK